jgi:hypothetical protein
MMDIEAGYGENVKEEDTPMAKRTMTLNLTVEEMRVLDDLCQKRALNKTALMRQALRLYQVVDARLERGEKMLFENEVTKEKSELMVL